jgi:hypothetical protein
MKTHLLAAAAVSLSSSIALAAAGEPHISPYWALKYRCVQRELGLAQAESQAVDSLRKECDAAGWKDIARYPAPNTRDLPLEEAVQKWRDYNKLHAPRRQKLTDRFDPRFEKILGGARVHRLQQIAWQIHRGRSLCDPDLQTALGLSDEQRFRIATLDGSFNDREDHLFLPHKRSSEEWRGAKALHTKADALFLDWNRSLADVLTAAQKKKLKEILGKPFDVSLLDKERDDPSGK